MSELQVFNSEEFGRVRTIDINDTTYFAASTTAKQLIFHVAELMRQMGFAMNYGPTEIDRSSTTEAYRWLARFRRTFGAGDSL